MIFPEAKSIICGYLISLLSSSPYKYKILKLSFKNDSDKERIQWNFMYSPQNCLYSSLQISPYLVSKHSFLGKQINNLGQIDPLPKKRMKNYVFFCLPGSRSVASDSWPIWRIQSLHVRPENFKNLLEYLFHELSLCFVDSTKTIN